MPTLSLPLLRRPAPEPPTFVPVLEEALVRRSVGALSAGRATCCHCHRTPLVGELIGIYPGARGDELVCELCRPLRTAAPERIARMRSPEHERVVRPCARA